MFKKKGKWALAAFLAVAPLLLTQTVQAQTPLVAKVTYITTDKPIELPGKILPAGRYMIRLETVGQVRNTVRILSPDQKIVYGTWATAPSYRLEPVNDNKFTFYEAPQDRPQPLHTWFFHGTQWGFEFLYPKEEAARIASYQNQNVRTTEATAMAQTTEPAQPEESPAAVDQNNDTDMAANTAPAEEAAPSENPESFAPQQTAALEPPANSQATPEPEAIPSELPKTASNEPLLGLAGLMTLFAAAGVRRLRKQGTH